MGIPYREFKHFVADERVVGAVDVSHLGPTVMFTVPTTRTWIVLRYFFYFPTKPTPGNFFMSRVAPNGVPIMQIAEAAYSGFPAEGEETDIMRNVIMEGGETIKIGDTATPIAKVIGSIHVMEEYR